MKTSLKITAGTVAGLLVGFVIGVSVQNTGLSDGSGRGDISKVSKYSRTVVSPGMSAFQEKILNDSTAMKNTAASLAMLNNRMSEFDKLVKVAVKASEGIDELKGSLEKLQKVSKLSENAKFASEQALQAYDAMVGGDTKVAPNQYETASQNLALAYLMVDRQLNVGKEFVCEVDSYLKGKKVEENLDLAMARDLWVGYCACEAVLTNDSDALAYWKEKQVIVDEQAIGYVIGNNAELALTGMYKESMGYNVHILSNFAPEYSETLGVSGYQQLSNFSQEAIGLKVELSNFDITLGTAISILANAEQMESGIMDEVVGDVIGYKPELMSNVGLEVIGNNTGLDVIGNKPGLEQ